MRAALASIALALLLAGPASAADRIAVVVGNDVGLPGELPLRYAEADARKVALVLGELGGFEADDIHLALGFKADDLQELLAELAPEPEEPRPTGAGPVVLLYYSGHSDDRDLHLAGTRLPVDELEEQLAATAPGLSILVLDSCQSGAATRSKGVTQGPEFDVEFLRRPDVEGQIVIASSTADEVAQESDRIEGSFFTHHLVAGLYGPADGDGDGRVTLEEAYGYARFNTVEQTIASRGGVQHPSYLYELSGQGDVVLSFLDRATARLEIRASTTAGEYYVLHGGRQLVLTEVRPPPGGQATLALPPGAYRVRKREADRVLVTDVDALPGATARVRDEAMRALPYGDAGVKGTTGAARLHGPRLDGQVRSPLVTGMSPAVGLRLGWQVGGSLLFVEPRLALRISRLDDESEALVLVGEIDAGLAAGVRTRPGQRLRLALALDLGVVGFWNRSLTLTRGAPSGAFPLGLQGQLLGRAGLRLTPALSIFATGHGGVAVFSENDATRVRPVVGGGLGLAVDFWR